MSLDLVAVLERPRALATKIRRRVGWRTRVVPDRYVSTGPSAQSAVDIFTGEWSSRFPRQFSALTTGTAALFEDARVDWAVGQFGGIADWRVLELGPLEGGHTYMLTRAGAAVKAIESNSRAYLKCLVAKEIIGYSAEFELGDCVEYLRSANERFDLCFASGVLYHMMDPVETIALLPRVSDRLFLWTHYYDDDVVGSRPELRRRFSGSERRSHDGFSHTVYINNYRHSLGWGGFCGGSHPTSAWLSRSDLLGALEHFGWHVNAIGFDEPDHPNGPALALTASKVFGRTTVHVCT